MWLHELDTGFHLEVAGRSVATVDVSRHVIEVGSSRRTRAFVASRAGVYHVASLLLHAASLRRPTAARTPARPPERDLFSVSEPVQTGGTKALIAAVVRALRRSASRRMGALEDVEQVVFRERRTPMVFSSPVLDAPYFLDDVCRFRAAAICAALFEEHPALLLTPRSSEELGARLVCWRSFFSVDGRITRALTKTLAELSDDVPARDVWALRRVSLVRPIASALHLRLLAEVARAREVHGTLQVPAPLSRLVQLADERALEEMRESVAAVFGFADASVCEQEHLLGEVLAEARDVDAPSLQSLVRRELARLNRWPALELNVREETARPPVALLEVEGITFLKNVGQVIAEGQRMRHCIGTRAAAAVRGEAFLFHIERNGERASVQLDVGGRVVEATGTQNFGNEAARWGAEVLGAWSASWGVRAD